mgnify:CR=1 FL=1
MVNEDSAFLCVFLVPFVNAMVAARRYKVVFGLSVTALVFILDLSCRVIA